MFITFEGIEGCGKTTQIKALHEQLTGRGLDVTATREPGGTAIGEAIRSVFMHCAHASMLPSTELLLVTAARAQHVAEVIAPALAAGKIVLCDRYVDATIAYQGHAGGLGTESVMACHERFAASLMPDITFLIDCPVETGLERSRARNRAAGRQIDDGRFEERDCGFHRKVREGYLEQARCAPGRFIVLEGGDTPESIQRRITQAALQRLRGAGYAV